MDMQGGTESLQIGMSGLCLLQHAEVVQVGVFPVTATHNRSTRYRYVGPVSTSTPDS